MGRRDAAGVMLREWRSRRRFSQLDLALASGVSAKHLSYVETGRSRPSPEMVLHPCEHLEVPLRDRNSILLAAGHAPSYQQSSYEAPTGEVRDLVDLVVGAHPYPAIVVDGRWDLVAANAAASLFLVGVADHLLHPTLNVIRLSLHADGLRPRVMNFDEYAGHVLARLRRLVAHSADPTLIALLEEFGDLDVAAPEHADGVVMPLVLDIDAPRCGCSPPSPRSEHHERSRCPNSRSKRSTRPTTPVPKYWQRVSRSTRRPTHSRGDEASVPLHLFHLLPMLVP